jgi:DNA polymerase III epsilon subunit-like protein
LAAVAIHSRSLDIIPGSEFCSLIRPSNIEAVEDGALKVNKLCVGEEKTGGHPYNVERDVLLAPPLNVVWKQFSDYVKQYNYKKNSYTAPILAGYNVLNFDKVIVDRICKEFGQWEDERQNNTLFSSFRTLDLMDLVWYHFEDDNRVQNIKLTTICELVGIETPGAHQAIEDCKVTAQLITRFMNLIRRTSKKVKWKPEKVNVE